MTRAEQLYLLETEEPFDPREYLTTLPYAASTRFSQDKIKQRPPHRWVYGEIAVVRAENNGYTVALDIHGGTENLPGFHKNAQAAIQRALFYAPTVLCVVKGENAGDVSREWRQTHSNDIFKSPGWKNLHPNT